MRSVPKSWLLQCIFAILFFLQQNVVAQEEILCRGQDLNMTEPQKAVITDCLREVAGIEIVWKIPMEKIGCFGVCILERKKLLTDDGLLNHQKILDYIQDVMKPDEVKKPLVDGTDKCMKEHGSKIKNDKDPNCLSFMETGSCVHDVFLDICVPG